MKSSAITYEQLLTRVIDDGIAAAKQSYAEQPDKLRGALEGFEACRGQSPAQLVALYKNSELETDRIRRLLVHQAPAAKTALVLKDEINYWRFRCRTLEIEWVCNVISVGLQLQDFPPLLPHQPTARAAFKYAEIVNVFTLPELPA
jgi:hypothetical protein